MSVCIADVVSAADNQLLNVVCRCFRLYTCSASLIAYSLLATSRLQVSGPAALDSMLTYSAIGTMLTLKTADPSEVPLLSITFSHRIVILHVLFR